jgi:hypothetical protein
MKTNVFSLAILLAAFPVVAQTLAPGDVISRAPASRPESERAALTHAVSEAYSLDQLSRQLRDLHRVVDETVPLLNAVSQTHSNAIVSGEPATGGGLAGILGGILNRNTNQPPAGGSEPTTNVLGGILRGVLGTNTTASASGNTTTLNDLAALRDHLISMSPILERLTPSALEQLTSPLGNSGTNYLTPTGHK